uniref:Uncharacterized protein n=1 Tax=Knipowitschia caucasica TaxID=637954 RepID=A0AAV2MHP3_KNICA
MAVVLVVRAVSSSPLGSGHQGMSPKVYQGINPTGYQGTPTTTGYQGTTPTGYQGTTPTGYQGTQMAFGGQCGPVFPPVLAGHLESPSGVVIIKYSVQLCAGGRHMFLLLVGVCQRNGMSARTSHSCWGSGPVQPLPLSPEQPRPHKQDALPVYEHKCGRRSPVQ